MKFSATLIAAGAGVVSAFPNAAPLDARDSNPWQAPGKGDVRAPCPGLNTLANHGFLPRNGKGISIPMVVKAFKDGFNMGSDIIEAAGGSALSVCQSVTKKTCNTFDLDQLNTPHTFEHDASFTREDYNFGAGNNHDFSQTVFNTVLELWKDTDIIDYSYANAARLMRIAACKSADKSGWFTESDGTQLTEMAFYMGTMGNPQTGNARKDWITYWWTHERFPFELGWAPNQRPEHNQSTINVMINNMINAPAPVPKKATSSVATVASASKTASTGSPSSAAASKATSSTAASKATSSPVEQKPVTLPAGYGFHDETSTVKIVPTTSPNAKPCTLPPGWTFTSVSTSLVAYKPTSTPVQTTTSAKPSSTTAAAATTSKITSVATPSGFSSFAVTNSTSAKPVTTTFLTTSVVYHTTEITVTSCAASITNCPAESKTPMVITKTISEFTTICPVTATIVPTGSSIVVVSSAAPTTAAPASTTAAFTYPQQTVSFTVVAGNPVVISSAAPSTAAASTAPAAAVTTTVTNVINIPNPYFTSVPVTVFPSVPASVVDQYSAATGAYAAPSLAPQYTVTGAAAISMATAPLAAVPTTPAAIGYGAAPSTASYKPTLATGAPIATAGAISGKGVSGAIAGLAVAALLL